MSDLAGAEAIVRARGLRLGDPLVLLDECASTNDEAKDGARRGAPHGAVWVAEVQTRGRGQKGRMWIASPGENLLFTVLLRVPCEPARVPQLSLACGLAVRDAVAAAIGRDEDVLVKWPNDVLVRRDGALRKIAGILVESAIQAGRVAYVVAGIGLNVHARAFPDELAAIATSIAVEREARGASGGDEPIDRATILASVLERLDHDVELVAARGVGRIRARLAARDALAGRVISVDGADGIAEGIDDEGRLVVRDASGATRRFASGEVKVGRPTGPSDVLGSGT